MAWPTARRVSALSVKIDQQTRGVARGVEEGGEEVALEGVELGVVGIIVPVVDERIEKFEVAVQGFDVEGVEVVAVVFGVLPLGVLLGRKGGDLLADFCGHVVERQVDARCL